METRADWNELASRSRHITEKLMGLPVALDEGLAGIGKSAVGAASTALRKKRARAIWALYRTGYKASGPSGEYGRSWASTCQCNRGGFTRNFFWDALFSSAGFARFNPEIARGAIRSVFSRQNSQGYWRGRTWPQISFWLLEMLWKEGYEKQADLAADRLAGAYMREDSFPENLAGDHRLYGSQGKRDYNWGIAFFLLLVDRAYRV